MTPDDLMFKPGLMKGHRILITGGGTGLGKEMAEGCLILGAEVFICGRRGGVLEEAADELMGRHGGKVVPIACDIRVPEAIHDMMDEIWAGRRAHRPRQQRRRQLHQPHRGPVDRAASTPSPTSSSAARSS